jgi:TRAP-type C4-dicarboxylate transport system permease small subunit
VSNQNIILILAAGFLAFVVFNALATKRVLRFEGLTEAKRLSLIMVIWVLPFVGALVAFIATTGSSKKIEEEQAKVKMFDEQTKTNVPVPPRQ